MWRRILIFIGLKIVEILGLCLLMAVAVGFAYLANKYLLFTILKWIGLSVLMAFVCGIIGLMNWEKAKKLEQKWFGKKENKNK